ncbi:MAG TPA: ribonuclease H-like domain-containing protein [Burkholderiales bacterium]|nr:ribonuclease H-like domain-containing protein [Burkholderiales bacterium]
MSDFRTRLGRLTGQAGESRPPAALPPSLAERLARLRTRAAEINARRPIDDELARTLGGTVVAPALLAVERSFSLPYAHGETRIAGAGTVAEGARLSLADGASPRAEALLFLDTETSGLAGGTGTVAFVLGLATIRDDGLVARQLLMTGFRGERPMLQQLVAALHKHRCIVTFNGKSFDLPLLRARARLADLEWPGEMPHHLDLLHVTRRRLREGWPDCRLRTAEERALGYARTDDLPGAEVPAAWQRWLQRGDASPLPRILDHNREDLLSLAGLLAVLAHPTVREAPLLHAPRAPPIASPLAAQYPRVIGVRP